VRGRPLLAPDLNVTLFLTPTFGSPSSTCEHSCTASMGACYVMAPCEIHSSTHVGSITPLWIKSVVVMRPFERDVVVTTRNKSRCKRETMHADLLPWVAAGMAYTCDLVCAPRRSLALFSFYSSFSLGIATTPTWSPYGRLSASCSCKLRYPCRVQSNDASGVACEGPRSAY